MKIRYLIQDRSYQLYTIYSQQVLAFEDVCFGADAEMPNNHRYRDPYNHKILKPLYDMQAASFLPIIYHKLIQTASLEQCFIVYKGNAYYLGFTTYGVLQHLEFDRSNINNFISQFNSKYAVTPNYRTTKQLQDQFSYSITTDNSIKVKLDDLIMSDNIKGNSSIIQFKSK